MMLPVAVAASGEGQPDTLAHGASHAVAPPPFGHLSLSWRRSRTCHRCRPPRRGASVCPAADAAPHLALADAPHAVG